MSEVPRTFDNKNWVIIISGVAATSRFLVDPIWDAQGASEYYGVTKGIHHIDDQIGDLRSTEAMLKEKHETIGGIPELIKARTQERQALVASRPDYHPIVGLASEVLVSTTGGLMLGILAVAARRARYNRKQSKRFSESLKLPAEKVV